MRSHYTISASVSPPTGFQSCSTSLGGDIIVKGLPQDGGFDEASIAQVLDGLDEHYRTIRIGIESELLEVLAEQRRVKAAADAEVKARAEKLVREQAEREERARVAALDD